MASNELHTELHLYVLHTVCIVVRKCFSSKEAICYYFFKKPWPLQVPKFVIWGMLYVCVRIWERAHFNLRRTTISAMGSNSRACTYISDTNLNFQMRISQHWKQLPSCALMHFDQLEIDILLQVGPFLKSYHILLGQHALHFVGSLEAPLLNTVDCRNQYCWFKCPLTVAIANE